MSTLEQIKANQQKSLIQQQLMSAFASTGKNAGQHLVHPFVLAVRTLRREIEFFEPFKDEKFIEYFNIARETYDSSTSILSQAELCILADNDVTNSSEQLQPLVEYHSNLLKIYRLLFTRKIEGSALIPSAPQQLQKQVDRTYEALGQLTKVISEFNKTPKEPSTKKSTSRSYKSSISKKSEEIEPPLEIDDRISPFITEGPKKGTILIEGVLFNRYV